MPCPKISQTDSKKINTLLLLWLPINKLWREEHTKTKLGSGSGGPITVKKLDSNNTSLPPFPETTKLESSVAMALHLREYSRASPLPLASGTIQHTIDSLVSTFRENGHGNSTKDNNYETGFLLSQQYCSFKNYHPQKEQHKALLHYEISTMALNQSTEINADHADISHLKIATTLHKIT